MSDLNIDNFSLDDIEEDSFLDIEDQSIKSNTFHRAVEQIQTLNPRVSLNQKVIVLTLKICLPESADPEEMSPESVEITPDEDDENDGESGYTPEGEPPANDMDKTPEGTPPDDDDGVEDEPGEPEAVPAPEDNSSNLPVKLYLMMKILLLILTMKLKLMTKKLYQKKR